MNNAGVQNSSLAEPRVPDGFAFGASEDGSPAISSRQAFIGAELLFSGNYNRAGVDLIISNETRSVTIPEYFKGEHRSTLMSPEGASLSGKVVEAMTARTQYAQADQIASAVPAVGNVAKVMGSAVVTRNGVSIELKQGDRLLKGDVVQTGTDTTIGISFVDGTALGLASNARVVLDEMTYDPNGSSNSSLLSLVQGTITLVAGHTAKFGNMRVETPVATMGIRGTAILVEIAADDGPTRFSVLREPDGKTGAFHLYDKGTGELIRVVSHAGLVTLVSPLGAGQPVSAIDQLKTLSDLQNEKNLAQQVFQIFFPNYNPDGPWANRTGSSSNGLANFSSGDAGQLVQSGVPALIALASSGSVIPIGATAQDVWIFPETPAAPTVTAIAVANVVDVQAAQGPVERNFAISDQVTITIDGQVIEESAGRYVPGTGTITRVESTAPTPQGVSLAEMVHIDPTTGVVTYDPSQFAFLGVGESAIYTIGFASRSGTSVVPEMLTLTINGLNDRPTVEHPIPDQRIREGCRFEYVIAAYAFADLDTNDTLSYRATLANGAPLPNWLMFDPVTLTFSGTPPKGEEGILHIKVIASDEHNATAVDQFDLTVKDSYHHHHRFDGDEMNGAMMASHEPSSVAVNSSSDGSTGTGDVPSDSGQEQANLATGARESDSTSCDEKFSINSARVGEESSTSPRGVASSSSDEHRSFDVSWNTTNNSVRAQDSIHTSVSTGFDSDTSASIDLHTGWSRGAVNYSTDSNSTYYSFVANNHSLTFSWSGGSGNQHRETANSFQFQRDISEMDSFVFRSDFGRDTTSDARSADVMQTGRSWSGDVLNIAALVHVTESFELFTMHGEQSTASLRQVSSAELQTHQNDFHLV
jgi:hypothetical protein